MNESSFGLLYCLLLKLTSLKTLKLEIEDNVVTDKAAKLLSLGFSNIKSINCFFFKADNCKITDYGMSLLT